jgi:hypothetical protein
MKQHKLVLGLGIIGATPAMADDCSRSNTTTQLQIKLRPSDKEKGEH